MGDNLLSEYVEYVDTSMMNESDEIEVIPFLGATMVGAKESTEISRWTVVIASAFQQHLLLLFCTLNMTCWLC